MASDNKRIEIDKSQNNDVRTLNNRFPKIDNLEYFPLKVLLRIFAAVGDIDLLNLAENSSRFERIAKLVVHDRYMEEYFTIDNAMWYSSQPYQNFVHLFGSKIKSLEAKETNIRSDNDWIKSLLNQMNHLDKLRFAVDSTTSNEYLLEQYASSGITHLTLRSEMTFKGNGYVLSKFRNLKKLALEGSPIVSADTFTGIIRNNPALESLFIGNKSRWSDCNEAVGLFPFDRLIWFIGSNLKQLKEFAYVPKYINYHAWQSTISDHNSLLDTFVSSIQHLESLSLSDVAFLFTDKYELLRRLGSECKRIKHLKLYLYATDAGDKDLFEAIRSFQHVESLVLRMVDFDRNNIVSLVEHLSFLHRLELQEILITTPREWSFVLELLSKCQSLEKLIINSGDPSVCVETLGTISFFSQFICCTQLRNVKIEVKCFNDENRLDIGIITRNEVTWRNKLLHWVGWDPILNVSNIQLLDLDRQSTATNAKQQNNPFELILGYLDLNSLQSLSRTNRKCSELVEKYVKRHSQQDGIFVISNEFFTDQLDEYKQLNTFTECVINLRIYVFHDQIAELQVMLQQLKNLNKLYVHTGCTIRTSELIVPQVKHFIFDGEFFQQYIELYRLSCACPDLETIELKRENLMDMYGNRINEENRLKFNNLMEFTLIYGGHTQFQKLQEIFKNTNTKLVFKNLPQMEE